MQLNNLSTHTLSLSPQLHIGDGPNCIVYEHTHHLKWCISVWQKPHTGKIKFMVLFINIPRMSEADMHTENAERETEG